RVQVERLGRRVRPGRQLQVAQGLEGVGQAEVVALLAVEGGGLVVAGAGGIELAEVAPQVAQGLEGVGQAEVVALLAVEGGGLVVAGAGGISWPRWRSR